MPNHKKQIKGTTSNIQKEEEMKTGKIDTLSTQIKSIWYQKKMKRLSFLKSKSLLPSPDQDVRMR